MLKSTASTTTQLPSFLYDKDLSLTIAVIGNTNVGKSAMIRHYSANYRSDRGATVGMDIHCFALPLANFTEAEVYATKIAEKYRTERVTESESESTETSTIERFINSFPPNLLHVHVRDVGGAELNTERMATYLTNIDGALIVTDGEINSVRGVDVWRGAVQKFSPDSPCILAWNKIDRYHTMSNTANVNDINSLNTSIFVSPSPSSIMAPRHNILGSYCKSAAIAEYHLCSAVATNALSVTQAIESTISQALLSKFQLIEQELARLFPSSIKTVSFSIVGSSSNDLNDVNSTKTSTSSLSPSPTLVGPRQRAISSSSPAVILPTFSIFDVPFCTS